MLYDIWLGEDYLLFDHGFAHLDDGRTLRLHAWPHTATYGLDSVLISDEESFFCEDFPLRWFIEPKGLSFYDIAADTPDVRLHNESGRTLRIAEYGVLENGSALEVHFEK